MSQLSFTDTDPIARTLGRSDLEPNDSVGSDSFLLKVGTEDEDIEDEDEEESEDSCEQVGSVPNVESRRSKKRRTCHVMFGIFTAVVVVFVIIAISIALVFTLRDHKDVSTVVGDGSGRSESDVGLQGQSTVTSENGSVAEAGLPHEEISVALESERGLENCSFPLVVRGDVAEGVYSFLGMRYARPPIGSLRWKPPQPWNTGSCDGSQQQQQQQKETTKQQLQVPELQSVPRCIQIVDGVPQGQEDCLYINVWTPTVSPSAGLHVIVYIHGGGLMTGSGLDIDSKLISNLVRERNVVVVTLNYRLNVFGFLSLSVLSRFNDETGQASGNYGLMDQVMALRWVQTYVKQFGGEPGKVTVMGQGSGATSIYALLASKSGRGLFSKAWLASPSPRLDTTLQEAEIQNLIFLNGTTCKSSATPTEQYDCLIGLSATSVIKALPWKQWLNDHFYEMPQVTERSFALAIVDGYLLNSSPIDAMKDRQFYDVPLLIGSTAQETDLKSTTEHQMAAWQYSDYLRQILAPFDYVDVGDVLRLYPPPTAALPGTSTGNTSRMPESLEEAISTVVSDMRVICPTDEVTKVAANMTRFSVYRYIASYMPSGGGVATSREIEGGKDGDEIRYVDQEDENKGEKESLRERLAVDGDVEIKTDSADGDTVLLESDLSPKENTIISATASHNCAYSGIDVDAFFGIDRRQQTSRVGSNSFSTFSKLMRDTVFEFIETGHVKAWRPFPDASYDISDVVRETSARFGSEKCDYWRTNSFYPQYTWMN